MDSGMADEPEWVAVSLRWRHVRRGDVVQCADGSLWRVVVGLPTVQLIDAERFEAGRMLPVTALTAVRPAHDATVKVLIPKAERDALVQLREQLDSRIIDRRVGPADTGVTLIPDCKAWVHELAAPCAGSSVGRACRR